LPCTWASAFEVEAEESRLRAAVGWRLHIREVCDLLAYAEPSLRSAGGQFLQQEFYWRCSALLASRGLKPARTPRRARQLFTLSRSASSRSLPPSAESGALRARVKNDCCFLEAALANRATAGPTLLRVLESGRSLSALPSDVACVTRTATGVCQ
jgi:hypothetical protein